MLAAVLCALAPSRAAEPPIAARVQALIPRIEAYSAIAMKAFDVPGMAIGIVAGDKLIYARGFGVRDRAGGAPVDTRTVFQIGSASKAFLATTLAIMVDRGKLHWDDRVVDLDPSFQMWDFWVTREFRVFDLLAQRSGLPPYANDALAVFGLDRDALIRSLRYVQPVSSFRSTFAYTNITHVLAGRIVARAAGAADWNAVLQAELLGPLGMKDSSDTDTAIAAAPDHASGYRWTPRGAVEVPFTPLFPYALDGAGDINSTVEDMAQWLRLQLGDGVFQGRRIVSTASLAYTRTPKVAITDKLFYALGWVVQQTPGGNIVWHNGGTTSFGAYVGLVPDRDLGIVVLSNEANVGFPDAVGLWCLDRILGNPEIDHAANRLKAAEDDYARSARLFAPPAHPQPPPQLAPLAGEFANRAIGAASVSVAPQGGVLTMRLAASGAVLELAPWDGTVFTARLLPQGRFATIAANLGPAPDAFAQFQIDQEGRLNRLRLSMDDGQAYVFRRGPPAEAEPSRP